jgi:predicted alternative tryptophan synthase beta-subunit
LDVNENLNHRYIRTARPKPLGKATKLSEGLGAISAGIAVVHGVIGAANG